MSDHPDDKNFEMSSLGSSSTLPSGSSSGSSSDPQLGPNGPEHRLPIWVKGLVLGVPLAIAIAVALFSTGYIPSDMFRPAPSAPTGTVETDPEEIANRKVVQDFILTDATGQQKKLSDFRGNVVILSFWASWCTPCLTELPTFAQLETKLYERGLRIVPVNVEEENIGVEFAQKFWAAQKFSFGSYFDRTKSIAGQFEVDMLPANFVLDRKGRVAFSGFGANDWSSPETVEFIESLLQEK